MIRPIKKYRNTTLIICCEDLVTSDLIQAILLDDLAVVEHVELLGGILAGEHHDALLTARVLRQKLRDVQHLVTDDDPAVLVGVVLGNFLCGHGHCQKQAGRLNWRQRALACKRCACKHVDLWTSSTGA